MIFVTSMHRNRLSGSKTVVILDSTQKGNILSTVSAMDNAIVNEFLIDNRLVKVLNGRMSVLIINWMRLF